MNNVDIGSEISRYKKINSKNSLIIVVLVGILVFVSVMAVYIRFFG
ncbi:MAG: hypothetical protein HFI36_05030 [Bacilli bacterium]|jgi:hypothetical protein|nr:hypothetical protein [Romboutsia ilealis]MCI8671378.1 hypothetical protein [Bacilli bacterium]MCX4254496.1 hypothetical protein [Bacilli bacterium]